MFELSPSGSVSLSSLLGLSLWLGTMGFALLLEFDSEFSSVTVSGWGWGWGWGWGCRTTASSITCSISLFFNSNPSGT